MKQSRILTFIIVAVLLIGGIVAVVMFSRSPAEQGPAPTPTPPPEKINVIPIEERPYAAITPSSNGRNITLTLGALKKSAAEGEYELDYQFGSNLQNGAFGMIKIAELPDAEYDILLGSCSAGGKCSYDEDVTGGALLLRFDDPEKYVLKNEWAFIDNSEKETSFVSRDVKFLISADSLASVSYGVILQTPGLPENVEGELVSDPYSVRFSTTPRGPFALSMRLKTAVSTAQMFGWDGSEWVELETSVVEKSAESESAVLYEAYVVVASTE